MKRPISEGPASRQQLKLESDVGEDDALQFSQSTQETLPGSLPSQSTESMSAIAEAKAEPSCQRYGQDNVKEESDMHSELGSFQAATKDEIDDAGFLGDMSEIAQAKVESS